MEEKDSFRNVGLVARPGSPHVVETLQSIIAFLDSRNIKIMLDQEIGSLMPQDQHQRATRKILGETCDLVIVVGGDGCLLGAARDLARYKVPLLGVNRGRLGFLTDILPSEVEERISEVLDGDYITEYRFLLEAQIKRDGQLTG